MTIENLQAIGEYVFVIKDEPETERYGIAVPEPSIKKPNIGTILSVGDHVIDKNVIAGKKAVFNKAVGEAIELFGVEITTLNGNTQITGVIDTIK